MQRLRIENKNDDILNYHYAPSYSVKTLPGGDMVVDIPLSSPQVPLEELEELDNVTMGGLLDLPIIEFEQEITLCKFSPTGRQIMVGTFKMN